MRIVKSFYLKLLGLQHRNYKTTRLIRPVTKFVLAQLFRFCFLIILPDIKYKYMNSSQNII